ncbi:MAG: hypothetical protein ACP5I3_12335 [Thermoproteus sp.]
MSLRERLLIAVIAIALLLAFVAADYALTYIAPKAVVYADSYNKTLILVIELWPSLYSERLDVTLRSLTGNSTYNVLCIRNSLYRGVAYVRYICNASYVEPGIYAVEIYKPMRIEGTVVVR